MTECNWCNKIEDGKACTLEPGRDGPHSWDNHRSLQDACERALALAERWNAVAMRLEESNDPRVDLIWEHATRLLNALAPWLTPIVESAGVQSFEQPEEAARPGEVLVEGSWFREADLPRVLGNFMRSSAEYAREAKELQAALIELRPASEVWSVPAGFVGERPEMFPTGVRVVKIEGTEGGVA